MDLWKTLLLKAGSSSSSSQSYLIQQQAAGVADAVFQPPWPDLGDDMHRRGIERVKVVGKSSTETSGGSSLQSLMDHHHLGCGTRLGFFDLDGWERFLFDEQMTFVLMIWL